jgi:hypothetical protein
MALPILSSPEFEATIPSTKQPIFFRPFLVKEEKVLFMALQGGDPKEIHNAVKNILGACIKTEGVEVEKLAMFDIEFLFLKLRGKSVGENIELNMNHRKNPDCNHTQSVMVNLDEINVIFPDDHTDTIMVTQDVGIKFKYPSLATVDTMQAFDGQSMDSIIQVIAESVHSIFDGESVHDQFTRAEVINFLESLNQTQFGKVTGFFSALPKLSHNVEWKCTECGVEESILIEGLDSFFT